jgi:hypothetical protein
LCVDCTRILDIVEENTAYVNNWNYNDIDEEIKNETQSGVLVCKPLFYFVHKYTCAHIKNWIAQLIYIWNLMS